MSAEKLGADVPVHADNKTPIIFNKNDATIRGTLHEIGKWIKRTKRHDALITHHAVHDHGVMYFDTVQAVTFYNNVHTDGDTKKKDIFNPCPPTPARIESAKDHAAALTLPEPTFATTIEPADSRRLRVLVERVDEDKASLIVSLNYVFGDAVWADTETEKAEGDGLAYLTAITERGNNASVKAKSAAAANFEAIKRRGVAGEFNSDNFNAFLKEYKAGKLTLSPEEQLNLEGATEASMINRMALSDPDLMTIYEIKVDIKPPGTLNQAAEIVNEILQSRKMNAVMQEALCAAPAARPVAAASNACHRSLVAGAAPPPTAEAAGLTALLSAAAAMTAAAERLSHAAPYDPKKDGLARDADTGRVTAWSEGMQDCRYCGGKHLHRLCTSEKAKEAEAKRGGREGPGNKKNKGKYSSPPSETRAPMCAPRLPPGLGLEQPPATVTRVTAAGATADSSRAAPAATGRAVPAHSERAPSASLAAADLEQPPPAVTRETAAGSPRQPATACVRRRPRPNAHRVPPLRPPPLRPSGNRRSRRPTRRRRHRPQATSGRSRAEADGSTASPTGGQRPLPTPPYSPLNPMALCQPASSLRRRRSSPTATRRLRRKRPLGARRSNALGATRASRSSSQNPSTPPTTAKKAKRPRKRRSTPRTHRPAAVRQLNSRMVLRTRRATRSSCPTAGAGGRARAAESDPRCSPAAACARRRYCSTAAPASSTCCSRTAARAAARSSPPIRTPAARAA